MVMGTRRGRCRLQCLIQQPGAVPLLSHHNIGPQGSHAFCCGRQLIRGRRLSGNRAVSQQRKRSCSNNVAQEPESVAKSGAHLFPSHIIIC